MTARKGARKPARKGAPDDASRRGRSLATSSTAVGDADGGSPAAPATTSPGGLGFPVVGVGASAGGLEAFRELIRCVPADTGMAFVLVSHLDPSRASTLTEILQRSTLIPVVEVVDRMPLARGRIHVIPPNREMRLLRGVLQLTVPTASRGRRMPIDTFLRSLAEDQAENAIGVLLSGTGSDGTLGLRSILGYGGITVVQDPATAKYGGMPAAAIRAGYATHVLPPEKMPAALEAGLPRVPGSDLLSATSRAGGLSGILMLLRSSTGHDFSRYKKSTIGRRIERRMALHGIDDLKVYARYLEEHPTELRQLFQELLINVSSFFRDPEAFEVLKREVLPKLLLGTPEGYVFRVWVAACATGEEAYSIAMVLREYVEEAGRADCRIQIYATDVDEDAISTARAGAYPENIAQDVSPERLQRFFVKGDEGYRVKRELREMVVLAVQNVIQDPPFTRLDLLSCRNLLIYLEPDLQERLVEIFRHALKPGGVLFLSPSESLGSRSDLLTPMHRRWKLFRADRSAAPARAVTGRGLHWMTADPSSASRPARARRVESPGRRAKALAAELARSEESIRTTVEEHRGSSEDLRSMNEELQSVNEELQSTNEELETSKEELQSVNEELVTVNAELQAKIEQLAGTQNDMRNLLDSVAVGVILLDGKLAIRRFTPLATRIFRVGPTDVGRPLSDIKSDVHGDDLLTGARAVLDDLVPWEREVVAPGGASYLARIQPYRTLDNVIDGVVMTFTDISARVRAEAAVLEAREVAESIVDSARQPMVVLEQDLTVSSASRAFCEQFQIKPEEAVGRALYGLGDGQWDIPELRELLEIRLPREGACDGYVLEHDFARIGRRRIVLAARRITSRSGGARRVLLMVTDLGAGCG